jgi:hypothetical protein
MCGSGEGRDFALDRSLANVTVIGFRLPAKPPSVRESGTIVTVPKAPILVDARPGTPRQMLEALKAFAEGVAYR